MNICQMNREKNEIEDPQKGQRDKVGRKTGEKKLEVQPRTNIRLMEFYKENEKEGIK